MDLPLGFAMALAQNPMALERFGTIPEQQKEEILRQAHDVGSKQEMYELVDGLANHNAEH